MTNSTLRALPQPEAESSGTPLTDLLSAGTRYLIARAVEAELQALLDQHAQLKLPGQSPPKPAFQIVSLTVAGKLWV